MRRPFARAFALALFTAVAALSVAPHARADAETDLDKGRNAYLARQYDEADARLKAMLDPKTGSVKDPVFVSQGLMLWGAVKVAKKQTAEASRLFEELLTKDPQFEPDPLSFPTEVLDVFSDTRHRIRERLAAAAREAARAEAEKKAREEAEKKRESERVARLERLASEETVRVERNRFVAFVPFGAGQFQNGQTTLGWAFLVSEAALVAIGTSVVPFEIAERKAMNEAYDPAFRPDATAAAETHRQNAIRLQLVNLISYGAFALTAVAGVVQANLVFSPETVRVRKREPGALGGAAPRAFQVRPDVSRVPGGATLGLSGRF